MFFTFEISDNKLVSDTVGFRHRSQLDHKKGDLGLPPADALKKLRHAQEDIETLLDLALKNEVPPTQETMRHALEMASDITSNGTINKEPWYVRRLQFLHELPGPVQAKLERIKGLWTVLWVWIVLQILCSGGTVFNVPFVAADAFNPGVDTLVVLLNYAGLADCSQGVQNG